KVGDLEFSIKSEWPIKAVIEASARFHLSPMEEGGMVSTRCHCGCYARSLQGKCWELTPEQTYCVNKAVFCGFLRRSVCFDLIRFCTECTHTHARTEGAADEADDIEYLAWRFSASANSEVAL